jgi:hypothetical protein
MKTVKSYQLFAEICDIKRENVDTAKVIHNSERFIFVTKLAPAMPIVYRCVQMSSSSQEHCIATRY